jgi:hypothetical protein
LLRRGEKENKREKMLGIGEKDDFLSLSLSFLDSKVVWWSFIHITHSLTHYLNVYVVVAVVGRVRGWVVW